MTVANSGPSAHAATHRPTKPLGPATVVATMISIIVNRREDRLRPTCLHPNYHRSTMDIRSSMSERT